MFCAPPQEFLGLFVNVLRTQLTISGGYNNVLRTKLPLKNIPCADS